MEIDELQEQLDRIESLLIEYGELLNVLTARNDIYTSPITHEQYAANQRWHKKWEKRHHPERGRVNSR